MDKFGKGLSQAKQPDRPSQKGIHPFGKEKPGRGKGIKNFGGDFGGFELNLQNTAHNIQIPIEIIQSTTRLIQPNPKMPMESENVRSWFWSIPTPKKKRNFLTKLLNNVGFSRNNLYSYFLCYILVLITYGIWISRVNPIFYQDLLMGYNRSVLFVIAGIALYISLILIVPIVSLGYTESESFQATRNDFFLKIEFSLFAMILGLNILIITIGGAIPIILVPGEPKAKITPPMEYVVKSIKRSVYPSLLLLLGAVSIFILGKFFPVTSIPFFETNVEILAYFSLSILLLELIPFGNTMGKILLKHKPSTFYFSFTLVIMLITVVISLAAPF